MRVDDELSESEIGESTSRAGSISSDDEDVYYMIESDTEIEDEGSEDDDESQDTEWVRKFRNLPLKAPFTGKPGLQLDMPADASPVDFYRLFVTGDVIKLMKSETNKYAQQKKKEKLRTTPQLPPRSIYNQWTSVTEQDIVKFLAILIHMGIVKLPKLSDHWSKDPSVATGFAASLMTRDRFTSILGFFHLNDNTHYAPRGNDAHDPLFKLRPLVDHLNETFSSLYTPGENISIDEALCPWRGRCAFRVYMRDKPIKWGMKLYELCESQSGYVYRFEVMCRMPSLSNKPTDVVLRLIDPLLGKGYSLYVDNYYCCPPLAHILSQKDTAIVGTVRANRVGLPADLAKKKMKRGELDFRRQNRVIALKWKDKRDVMLLTTKHQPVMMEAQTRTERKQKPVAVMDYTKNMAGVDLSDQLISYLPLHRKTIKWWKKLTFHLLTLTMIQAQILFNKHQKAQGKRVMHLDTFVKSVCNSLATVPVGPREPQPGPSTPAPSSRISRLHDKHFLQEIRDSQGKKLRRACKVCYSRAKKAKATREELRNKRQLTYFQCKQCQVPLCMEPCMERYHTVVDFSK